MLVKWFRWRWTKNIHIQGSLKFLDEWGSWFHLFFINWLIKNNTSRFINSPSLIHSTKYNCTRIECNKKRIMNLTWIQNQEVVLVKKRKNYGDGEGYTKKRIQNHNFCLWFFHRFSLTCYFHQRKSYLNEDEKWVFESLIQIKWKLVIQIKWKTII